MQQTGTRFIYLTIVALVVLTLGLVPAIGAQATFTVVAQGLNNPRGITFGYDGALYVAEAGKGGAGPCGAGPVGDLCFGNTGSISRIDVQRGIQERILTGLPSLAAPNGMAAFGAHDIGFLSRTNGYVVMGLGGDPTKRTATFGPGAARLGTMLTGAPGRGWKNYSDLGAYEARANPDRGLIDTDPYSVLVLPGRTVVADAGANAVVQVDSSGAQSTLAVFPDRMVDAPPFLGMPPGAQIPMQAVPTTVVMGPDGALYVGQLTGFPFPVGGANVYKVPANGGTPTVYASGFSSIIDIAFGRDGSLYVLEIAKNGLLAAEQGGDFSGGLFRVAPNGTKTEILVTGLMAPGGLVIAPDGSIYITNKAVLPDTGEVLRISP